MVVGLDSWAAGSCSRSPLLHLFLVGKETLPVFPWSSFSVLGFTFMFLIHLELSFVLFLFCRVIGRGLISLF